MGAANHGDTMSSRFARFTPGGLCLIAVGAWISGCAPAARDPGGGQPSPVAADSRPTDRQRPDSVGVDRSRHALVDSLRVDSLRADSLATAKRAALAASRRDSVRTADELRARAARQGVAAERAASPRPPARFGAGDRRAGDLRVCSGGDVTLGTNMDTTWVTTASRRAGFAVPALPPPGALLAPLRAAFGDADLALLNVEGAIGEGPVPPKCRPGSTACFAMRQPLAAADALRSLLPTGVVVGNVANNHAGDAGLAGFDSTLAHLTRAGVLVTGVDTLAVPVDIDGYTLGVLGFAVSPRRPDARDLDAVRRHVRRAADRYGRVIVTVHMGAEGAAAQRTRSRTESYYDEDRGNPVAFAEAAVGAGASLVIGHGPHVLRAMEWRDSSLVAYSLGNLVTHGPFVNREPLNRGAVLCATISAGGTVVNAEVRPTVQRRAGQVEVDSSRRALVLIDSLGRLDFPRTGARIAPDGSVGRVPTVQRRRTPR